MEWMNMEWIIIVALFVGIVCLVEGIFIIARKIWDPEARAIRRRLDDLAEMSYQEARIEITRKRRVYSLIPSFHAILEKIPLLNRLDRLVIQANTTQPLGFFILLTLVIFMGGFALTMFVAKGYLVPFITGCGFGCIPFFYLNAKKKQRTKKFEQQFPEALDLMARSMKAGHAFNGGLQMVAEEFGPPIGPEFHRIMNEVNYGGAVDQALKGLSDRIELDDLKFFTVSVIIQRESGGNLAEILENIASLIRERFKLRGKIKSLSAEGRLSGGILVALPFLVAFVLMFINPGYMDILFNDATGRMLILVAILMMGMGIYLIRRITQIRV